MLFFNAISENNHTRTTSKVIRFMQISEMLSNLNICKLEVSENNDFLGFICYIVAFAFLYWTSLEETKMCKENYS